MTNITFKIIFGKEDKIIAEIVLEVPSVPLAKGDAEMQSIMFIY